VTSGAIAYTLKRALSDANLKPADIDEVVLVGARMPVAAGTP